MVDQLDIHQSEEMVKLVASEELGIELELNNKGNLKKNMKAMASRRGFLAEPAHGIRFVYTPRKPPPG